MSSHDRRRKFAVQVVAQLRDAGYEALWAGGCVRDLLLGKHPKDYDVATSAEPEAVRKVFGQRRTLPIGAAFGVISVMGSRQEGHIEIATFRQDAGYSDGRRPDSVRFSSAQEDAQRRDFTINGIFYDPLNDKVIDYVGGQEDLRKKVIRAIGNAHDRIAEDKLRMLRGVRFAATYGFRLDPQTLEAIQSHAQWLSAVSRERIAAEIQRMFGHPKRGLAAKYLVESGLHLAVFASPLFDLDRQEQAVALVQQVTTRSFATALAAFLLPLYDGDLNDRQQEKKFRSTLHDWKYSNDEAQAVTWLLKHFGEILSAGDATWPDVQRKLVHPEGRELVALADAVDRLAGSPDRRSLDYCHRKLELPEAQLNPAPLLNGSDLIQAGFRPGPGFKESLERIRDLQLRGEIATRSEALRHVARILGQSE